MRLLLKIILPALLFTEIILPLELSGNKSKAKSLVSNYQFADYLFKKKEYYRAYVEFQRAYFDKDDNKDKNYGRLRSAESAFVAKQFQLAITELNSIESTYQHERVAWLLAFNHAKLKNYHQAQNFIKNSTHKQITLYQTKLWQFQDDLMKETKRPTNVTSSSLNPLAKSTLFEIPTFSLATNKFKYWNNTWPPANQKSPYLAALYSMLLPGSGYAYAGSLGNALSSFLINGFFISSGIIAALNNEALVSYGIFGVGSIFYIGNIYGSYRAANTYNKDSNQKLKNELDSFSIKYKFSVTF